MIVSWQIALVLTWTICATVVYVRYLENRRAHTDPSEFVADPIYGTIAQICLLATLMGGGFIALIAMRWLQGFFG